MDGSVRKTQIKFHRVADDICVYNQGKVIHRNGTSNLSGITPFRLIG